MRLTDLKKTDFKEILSNYNIGKYKSSKHIEWALGNTVYILNTTKSKFILKVFEGSDPEFIKFQTKIIGFCSRKGLPVPKIIKTKSKHNLLLFRKHRIQVYKREELYWGKYLERAPDIIFVIDEFATSNVSAGNDSIE